jgi:hypothetical protein
VAVKTIVSSPYVLSVLAAAIAVPANAGIRHMGKKIHMTVEQSENLVLQERAPAPMRPHTGEPSLVNSHDAPSLRPVTRGMRPPMRNQQVALAGSSAAVATKTMRGESTAKPQDVTIDVIVAYTKKATRNYADIEHQLIDLAIEEAN